MQEAIAEATKTLQLAFHVSPLTGREINSSLTLFISLHRYAAVNKQSLFMAEYLTIPPLESLLEKNALGEIRHVLHPAETLEIRETREVSVSARRRERMHILGDGQTVIVTTRRNIQLPEEADGILLEATADSPAKWLAHRRLNELAATVDASGIASVKEEVAASWKAAFNYNAEVRDDEGRLVTPGLRPPQIGALHAIGAHWSLSNQTATIVMPTGTGKTETMLALLIAYVEDTLLVGVPSQALRDQTTKKFLTLGLLRKLGNINETARYPVVGICKHRPRVTTDLEMFSKCNVVIGTISSIAQGAAEPLIPQIAERTGTLVIDEAHHVPANSWSRFRDAYASAKVLQFTATPYRRDGKLVDGKVIFDYPLHTAQRDGYFKPISFEPVCEIDEGNGDLEIAQAAIARLRENREEGLSHIIMARTKSTDRADEIHGIYERLGPEFNPVLVYQGRPENDESLERLKSGESQIVVCVDMLGEGFDLPSLKIAAVHDTHKSLAVVLQFTGRFTRTAGDDIGDATVIANIANQDVSVALERLYREDADWNQLLSESSSEAIKEHFELVEFLQQSRRLLKPGDDEEEGTKISQHLLRPKFSTLVYRADAFNPRQFFKGLSNKLSVNREWLNEETNTLFFVTVEEPRVAWTRSTDLLDREWHLYVVHYNEEQHLLFINSSDKSGLHEKLANVVGATEIVTGEQIFRAFGRINRLLLQNVGVRKHGRRNLSYSMYTGANVREALTLSEKAGSSKSNLSGSGWENGKLVTVGCAVKGRVWSKDKGSLPEFVRWCGNVGRKLIDETIDTAEIIENVLIPEEIQIFPDIQILCIEWPMELLNQPEERIVVSWERGESALTTLDITSGDFNRERTQFDFSVSNDDVSATFQLELEQARGFEVVQTDGPALKIQAGKIVLPLANYFSDYPPLMRFVDLSEVDGQLLIRPNDIRDLEIPENRFEIWNWDGVNIQIESIWRGGERRDNSIQEHVAQYFQNEGFDVVFDDDAAGEAADLVCLKEHDDHIQVVLAHCKFTSADEPGRRLGDVVDVCSQAVRSGKWLWKFRELCQHVINREKRLSKDYRPSRFLVGDVNNVHRYMKANRVKQARTEVLIVQPGLSHEQCTGEQRIVLAAAHSFLKETVDVDLTVVCSR